MLAFRIFGLLTSSLLFFSQRFCRYLLCPSSGVTCWTQRISNWTLYLNWAQAVIVSILFVISTCCWDWTCNVQIISLRSTFQPNALFIAPCVSLADMVNRIGTVNPRGTNKGFTSRFCMDSRVRHETPEESQRTYRPKHWEYNNKDGVSSPNILNIHNYQVTSQKFWQVNDTV